MLTRFDERNVNMQCPACNTYREGEQAKHFLYIERKHGREAVDDLMGLERKWKIENRSEFGIVELREMQKHYQEKGKELEGLL